VTHPWLVVALWAALCLWVPSRGRAAPPGRVVVVSEACAPPVDAMQAWLSLLRVELADDGIDVQRAHQGAALDPAVAQARLELAPCGAAARSAALTVSHGQTSRTRTLDLEDVAQVAQARVIAIAMAGLIRSTLAEARIEPTPAAPAASPEAAQRPVNAQVDLPPEPQRAPRRWRGLVLGEARLFPQGKGAWLGARMGTLADLFTHAWATLDAGVLVNNSEDPLGEVRSVVSTLGVGLLAGGGKTVRLGLGPRIEAGFGRFRGHSVARGSTATATSSPLVFAGVSGVMSFPIAGPCSGLLALDGGATVYGFYARAGSRRLTELRGPLVSLRLGLSF
jgi:hypothetical protein